MGFMETLTIYQLRSRGDQHFAAVESTPGIDAFCSSLDWTLPAYEAFMPENPLYLRAEGEGFVNLARGFNPRIGRYFQPLESSWCLASPFVGPDPDALIEAFARDLRAPTNEWDLLYLSGIPTSGSLYDAVVRNFVPHCRVGLGHETRRYVADLHESLDIYLAHRSSKMRHNMRRAARRAADHGVTYEYLSVVTEADANTLYERILRVEERSWKGMEGTGILDGGMNTFYRLMLPRLARRGGLRVLFARHADTDIAFVFGGLLGDTYRGLQVSFDDAYREFALGNLMQMGMIERLCDEGIKRYDLGSELEYKSRWAENVHSTTTLWVWRK